VYCLILFCFCNAKKDPFKKRENIFFLFGFIFLFSFMRVFLFGLGSVLFFSTTGTSFSLADSTEFSCEVSAYYTANASAQENGQGTHGADGTPVYDGMLSASKKHSFGSKIFIPGLGVGTVHDRGGSVTGNKIDVWMGYGEEGRKRAINWGRKILTCSKEDETTQETISFEKKFSTTLEKGDKGGDVEKMQRFLQDQGFFKEKDFGTFGKKTQKAVFEFQVKYNIVESEDDVGAGIWGPKTRKKASVLLK